MLKQIIEYAFWRNNCASAQCCNMRWRSYIAFTIIFLPLTNCIGNLTYNIRILSNFYKEIHNCWLLSVLFRSERQWNKPPGDDTQPGQGVQNIPGGEVSELRQLWQEQLDRFRQRWTLHLHRPRQWQCATVTSVKIYVRKRYHLSLSSGFSTRVMAAKVLWNHPRSVWMFGFKLKYPRSESWTRLELSVNCSIGLQSSSRPNFYRY